MSVDIADTIGIGSPAVVNAGIMVQGNVTNGSVSQTAIEADSTASSGATQDMSALAGRVRIPAGLHTGATYALYLSDLLKGAGAISDVNYGIYIQPITNGEINYAIYSGTGKVHFGDSLEVHTDTGLNICNADQVPSTGSGTGISGNGTHLDLAVWNGAITRRAGNDGSKMIIRETLSDKGMFRWHSYGAGILSVDANGNITSTTVLSDAIASLTARVIALENA